MPYPPPPQRPTYDYGGGGSQTMLDLIMRQGQIQAEGARASGSIWGNALGQIGQTIAGGIQQRSARREEEQERNRLTTRDAVWTRFVESGEWQQDPRAALSGSLRIWGPEKGPQMAQGLLAFQGLSEKGDEADTRRLGMVLQSAENMPDPVMERFYPAMRQRALPTLQRLGIPVESLPEAWTPETGPQLRQSMSGLRRAITGERAPGAEEYTLAPGQQRRRGSELIAENPPTPPAPRTQMVTVPGPGGRPVARLASEEELAQGVPVYREPRQGPAPERPGWQWVIRDGQHVQIRNGDAQPGDTPASVRERASSGVERKALGYYQSMEDAEKVITSLAGKTGSATFRRGASDLPIVGDVMLSDAQQQYKQALNSFAQAYLRKESGATITDTERNEVEKTFFEMPNDSPAVLAQKAAARERLKANARFQSGTAYSEYYGEAAPRPSDAPNASAGGPVVGERRTANGETREWDGKEWRPVQR